MKFSIKEPCHENWDKMTPNEQGRACAKCNKTVHDFTRLNNEELATKMQSLKGQSVCGRMKANQLGRDVRFPVFKWMIPSILAFSLSGNLVAQIEVPENIERIELEASVIKGRILDRNTKEPVYEAYVSIKGTLTTVFTNVLGEFELRVYEQDSVTLVIQHLNYETTEVVLKDLSSPSVEVYVDKVEEPEIFNGFVEMGEVMIDPIPSDEK